MSLNKDQVGYEMKVGNELRRLTYMKLPVSKNVLFI